MRGREAGSAGRPIVCNPNLTVARKIAELFGTRPKKVTIALKYTRPVRRQKWFDLQ
jgi:hypothetical protein